MPRRLSEVFEFHKKHGSCASTEGSSLDDLKNILSDLIRFKFLVQTDYNEWKRLDYFRRIREHTNAISVLYILPTTHCNLNCKYCYVYQGDAPKAKRKQIKWETLVRGIDYFFHQASKRGKKKPLIIFSGGEPLLKKDLIKKSVNYINKRQHDFNFNAPCKIGITTNGTLITKDFLLFLKKHNVALGISIDGMPKNNDRMRVYRGGKTSSVSERLFDKISLVEDLDVPYTLTMALHEHNTDINQHIKWISHHFKTKDIDISLPHPFKSSANVNFISPKVFSKTFFKSLLKEVIKRDISFLKYDYFAQKFFALQPILHGCAPTTGQITIHPDGFIGNCSALFNTKKNYISMDNLPDDLLEHPFWKTDTTSSPIYRRDCYLNCEYFSLCTGGCFYDNECLSGSKNGVDPTFCNFNKAMVDLLSEEMIDHFLNNS